jgi:hypothetical protein
MVSAEGACAAYYAYGRHLKPHKETEKSAGTTMGGAA